MDNQNPNPSPQPQPVPVSQPTLSSDIGTELLAELRGLRAAVESNRAATEAGGRER